MLSRTQVRPTHEVGDRQGGTCCRFPSRGNEGAAAGKLQAPNECIARAVALDCQAISSGSLHTRNRILERPKPCPALRSISSSLQVRDGVIAPTAKTGTTRCRRIDQPAVEPFSKAVAPNPVTNKRPWSANRGAAKSSLGRPQALLERQFVLAVTPAGKPALPLCRTQRMPQRIFVSVRYLPENPEQPPVGLRLQASRSFAKLVPVFTKHDLPTSLQDGHWVWSTRADFRHLSPTCRHALVAVADRSDAPS